MAISWRSRLLERRFYYVIGLAGVSIDERRFARRIGTLFSSLMIAIAILLLLEWQWQLLREIDAHQSFLINWVVFIFFVVTYIVEILIVKNRWRFVGQNWSLPIIILAGIPFLIEYTVITQPLSALRPALALYILFPSLKMLINFFFDGHLRTTILGAAVVVVIFGVLVAGVDPNVKDVWDGIWWAIATVATIGYGDVVPSSALGRLLGAILVVLGVAIFVIITANILAFTLKKERSTFEEEAHNIDELKDEIREMKEAQQQQNKLLKELSDELKDQKKK